MTMKDIEVLDTLNTIAQRMSLNNSTHIISLDFLKMGGYIITRKQISMEMIE